MLAQPASDELRLSNSPGPLREAKRINHLGLFFMPRTRALQALCFWNYWKCAQRRTRRRLPRLFHLFQKKWNFWNVCVLEQMVILYKRSNS